MTFCSLDWSFAGIATCCSSCDRYRWRTIGIAGGFVLVELILKAVSRMFPSTGWLANLTIFGTYEPQLLVIDPGHAISNSVHHDGILILLGLAAYIAALVIFGRRDLPAPL